MSGEVPCNQGVVPAQGGSWAHPAIKQRIQSSHMPPCHRHMVVATKFSSMFDLLLCSTPQTWAECCLELTTLGGVGGWVHKLHISQHFFYSSLRRIH